MSVGLGFFVKTGARDEYAKIEGVSHFLEHMMFKGTPTRSGLDITYQLGAIGAQANAFTSEENTVYYMGILPEYFQDGLELLSDMMRPSLDPVEFATEKKVILEEIALYKDRPTFVLFERALREYFKDHPAGTPVLGSVETVSALTPEEMRSYFDSHYTAANTVLAASGNFKWEELVALGEKYCGHWLGTPVERQYLPHKPKSAEHTLTKENLQRAHAVFVGPGPTATEEERYAAQVLSCILGDGSGSRAYWQLVDKGLADSASIDSDDMDGLGIVMGYVSSDPERIDDVSEVMLNIMKTPREFSDGDLERAKTKIRSRIVLQGESSMRRLMAIGLDWQYRNAYHTLEDELVRVQQVSKGEIHKMLERYSFTPLVKVKMIPA